MNVPIDKLEPELWIPEGEIFSISLKYNDKFIAWALIEAELDQKDVKLWFISTHKKYRRLGLASKLLKMIQSKHDSITTNAYSINDEGSKTLMQNGFTYKPPLFNKEVGILSWATKKTEKEE
jgi:ribosomal protein S18 acetylase RimI-like enzyme